MDKGIVLLAGADLCLALGTDEGLLLDLKIGEPVEQAVLVALKGALARC